MVQSLTIYPQVEDQQGTPRTNVAKIVGQTKKSRAVDSVRTAARVGQSDLQRLREEREEAEQVTKAAMDAAEAEEAQNIVLKEAAGNQIDNFPQTLADWETHVFSGFMPSLEYIFWRITDENGDWCKIVKFLWGSYL